MMNSRFRRRAYLCPTALALLLIASPATAEITAVRGSARSRVVQFVSGIPVQSDYGQEIIPLTKGVPPAIARARLDHLEGPDQVTAAGQGVAIMFEPNTTGTGNPNDAGLDVGSFSDDSSTGWVSEGGVTSTRTLVLSLADVGGQSGLGDTGRARSRLLLSGVMVIFSQNPSADLTGNEVSFSFSVTRRQNGRATTTPLIGDISMIGGPNGSVEFRRQAGALANVTLPVADFPLGEEFPLVRAVIFNGIQFPYEYDITVDTPFDLELNTAAKVTTTPGGIGATATFGLPQEGIASVVGRVKLDDRGQRLAQWIGEHVDTTGESYVGAPAALGLIPACGAMSFELVGMMVVAGGLALVQSGRRRRR